MAAVLQTALDDCFGSAYRRARGYPIHSVGRDVRNAGAYVASDDRRWPFSFENLCEALGLDPGSVRKQLIAAAGGRRGGRWSESASAAWAAAPPVPEAGVHRARSRRGGDVLRQRLRRRPEEHPIAAALDVDPDRLAGREIAGGPHE